MAWVAKVNRHVTVLKFVSSTVTKRRPGIITAIALDGNPVIRVRHHDSDLVTPGFQPEVYGNATNGVPRRVDVNENLTVTKYISY